MKRAFLVFFFSFLPVTVFGANCFEKHLSEAMELNQQRLPRYSALSQGQSEEISRNLLRMEGQMLLLSRVFAPYDQRSLPYQQAGIPITCDVYVPMRDTPKFRDSFRQGTIKTLPPKSRELVSTQALWSAYHWGGLEKTLQVSLDMISRLKEQRTHCLTRHFLESIARIAASAPLHAKAAAAKGLPDPTFLHRQMIWGHLFFLETVFDLDDQALPLNVAGLPILCQDVPPIPLP